MERLSIEERLRMYAGDGFLWTRLNLYPRQEAQLLRKGLAVQRSVVVKEHSEQNRCLIGWEFATPGSFAYELREEAIKSNPDLRKKLQEQENDERPVSPPYTYEGNEEGGGWTL